MLSRKDGFALMFNNPLFPGVGDFGFGKFAFDIGAEVQAFGPGGHQRQMGDFGDILVLVDATVQKLDLQRAGSLFETDGLDIAGHHINAFHGDSPFLLILHLLVFLHSPPESFRRDHFC